MQTHRNKTNPNSRRGSASKAILFAAAGLAVAGVAFYHISPRFKQGVTDIGNDLTTWTPERINKDKPGYLKWAGSQLDEHHQKLEARRLDLVIKRASYDKKRREQANEQSVVKKLLDAGKVAFRAADAANTWPVKFEEIPFTKEKFKLELLALNNKFENGTKELATFSAIASRLDVEVSKVDQTLARVKRERENVKSSVTILEARREVENIDNLRTAIDEILNTSGALVSGDDLFNMTDVVKKKVADANAGQTDSDFDRFISDGAPAAVAPLLPPAPPPPPAPPAAPAPAPSAPPPAAAAPTPAPTPPAPSAAPAPKTPAPAPVVAPAPTPAAAPKSPASPPPAAAAPPPAPTPPAPPPAPPAAPAPKTPAPPPAAAAPPPAPTPPAPSAAPAPKTPAPTPAAAPKPPAPKPTEQPEAPKPLAKK